MECIIKSIVETLKTYMPESLILFGSIAKGRARAGSDVDICVVADCVDKRRILGEMYAALDVDIPVDIVLYTPGEWRVYSKDCTSFAYKIKSEGKEIYGRQQEI